VPCYGGKHHFLPTFTKIYVNGEKEALILASSHTEKKDEQTLRARSAAAAAENVQEEHYWDYFRYDILRMLGRRGLSPWRQHALLLVVLLSFWTTWTGRNVVLVVVRAVAVVAEQEASTTTKIQSIPHPRVLQSVTEQRKHEYINLALANYPPIMVRFCCALRTTFQFGNGRSQHNAVVRGSCFHSPLAFCLLAVGS
jgi:hypothetical protein